MILGRQKGGAPIKKRRANAALIKKGGVRTKLADLANVGTGKAQRAIQLADRDPKLLAEVSAGRTSLNAAYDQLGEGDRKSDSKIGKTSAEIFPKSTEPVPEKSTEISAEMSANPASLEQRKVLKWWAHALDKFLTGSHRRNMRRFFVSLPPIAKFASKTWQDDSRSANRQNAHGRVTA